MILRWLETNLWRAAALALAIYAAALLVQIHGAPIMGGGLKPALADCQGSLDTVLRAQAEADLLQAAVNEDEERRTAANATRSDTFHAQDLLRALAAGRSFADINRIAADRVRTPGDRGATGAAPATTESGGAGIHESLPADTFVAVSDPDLQACAAAVTWAVGAFNWAQTLTSESNLQRPAEPPPAR